MLHRAALPLALMLTACAPPAATVSTQTTSGGVVTSTTQPSQAGALVRVIHASPDTLAQTVMAYLDNSQTPAVPDLNYRSAAGYTPIPAGAHSVQARVPGMLPSMPAPINWTTPELIAGHAYTIIAHGLATDLTGPQVTFSHDEDALTPAPRDRALLRFFHALVNGGVVDVCLSGSTPAFVGVAYGTFATAAGVPGHYAATQPGTASVSFRASAPGRAASELHQERGRGVEDAAHRIEIVLKPVMGERLDDHPYAVRREGFADVAACADRVPHVVQTVEHRDEVIAARGKALGRRGLECRLSADARVVRGGLRTVD